jgi:hypothetical protein
MLTDYSLNLIEERCADLDQRRWVIDQIEGLKIQMDNPPDTWIFSSEEEHTQNQVGHLAGLMDLERPDRLEMLSIILGYEPYWSGEQFEGSVSLDDLPEDKAVLYPGPSSKDTSITRWQHSVLIDFYMNNPFSHKLHEYLGYQSLRVIRSAKRTAREAARKAKTAQLAADKAKRKAEREAKKQAKLSGMGTATQ